MKRRKRVANALLVIILIVLNSGCSNAQKSINHSMSNPLGYMLVSLIFIACAMLVGYFISPQVSRTYDELVYPRARRPRLPLRLYFARVGFAFLCIVLWPFAYFSKKRIHAALMCVGLLVFSILVSLFLSPLFITGLVTGTFLIFIHPWGEQKLIMVFAKNGWFVRYGANPGSFLVLERGNNKIGKYVLNVKGWFLNDKRDRWYNPQHNIKVMQTMPDGSRKEVSLLMYNENYQNCASLPVLHGSDHNTQRLGTLNFQTTDIDSMYLDLRPANLFWYWQTKFNIIWFGYPGTVEVKKVPQRKYELVEKKTAEGEITGYEVKEKNHPSIEVDYIVEDNYMLVRGTCSKTVTMTGPVQPGQTPVEISGPDACNVELLLNYAKQFANPSITFETYDIESAETALRSQLDAIGRDLIRSMSLTDLLQIKTGLKDLADNPLINQFMGGNKSLLSTDGSIVIREGYVHATGYSLHGFKLVDIIAADKNTRDIMKAMSNLFSATLTAKQRLIDAQYEVEIQKEVVAAVTVMANAIAADNSGNTKFLVALKTIEKFTNLTSITLLDIKTLIDNLSKIGGSI